jgi:N-acetyl-gamma-glutamyl-phosphate reductase common form
VPAEKVRAAVLGAGGFVGGELLRLLATHPRFELCAALSATHAGRALGDVYPGLGPWTSLRLADAREWRWEQMKEGPWVLFSALGHRETMTALPALLEKLAGGMVKAVDLSGDFRLKKPELYPAYYGYEHAAPRHLERFVYGLPEAGRERIAGADLVANPGCFATGAQLAILPLASCAAVVRFVAIDSKTGSSGAGVRPTETTHHPNRMNNFRAYRIMKHQHTPEILAGWLDAGGSSETQISFAPHMAPMVRGIFTTAHVFCDAEVSPEEIRDIYQSYYRDAPFVRLVEDSPAVTDVWGSNRCDVSVTASGRRIVVCTAIDNLVKGAAGQAVQNANLMNGFEETAGLLTPPPAPV